MIGKFNIVGLGCIVIGVSAGLVSSLNGQGTSATPGVPAPRAPVTTNASIANIVPPPCITDAPLVLAVEAGRMGGDGSSARPYGSIPGALAAAIARKVCAVVILLGPGDYRDPVVIKLPHVKIGNRAAVVLAGGSPPPRPVVRASIEHRSGGLLELEGIDVRAPAGVAIRQVGGRMSLRGVSVAGTAAQPKNADTGIGLWVSDGGDAVVQSSTFLNNAHQGVRAEGPGTRLWVQTTTIRQTGVHPLVLTRMKASPQSGDFDVGALHVKRSASSWINNVTIDESAVSGVHVSQGARMRFERSIVNRTTSRDNVGGHAVSALTGGQFEWLDSSVTEATICGVSVGEGLMTLNGGFITRTPVGACTRAPKSPSDCLRRGTQYREVGVPLQGDRYPVPNPLGGSAALVCPSVPTEATPSWWRAPVATVTPAPK